MSDAREIAKAINATQRAAAKASPSSFLAKVVSSSGGYYTLVTPEGRTIRHVNSAQGYQLQADSYQTVEQTAEGLMQISAPGAYQSE